MKESEDNNVYLTLDDRNSDAVILKHNLQALKNEKNAVIEETAKALVSIPAALVRMKWQYRREIYAFQVKEEIYGAALAEIMTRNPQLKEKILAHVEASYQHILARETATLRLTRKLADGNCRTASVNIVAPEENLPSPVVNKA
ncbi:cytoplasmic protein [Scandinavium manionii]|uniref:cytoplasmic protein n=1 Tax=Scandinavium manionii TaxID=2926520 RepID=UPI0021659148|nr:cytoplasmic protein [Scandinavium manionii]MCS2166182.1 cytoplasmic protein [Scandinavium manionii]